MTETFVALLFAHALADFLLQPAWMVDRKRETGTLLLHTAIVFGATIVALGGALWPAVFVALVHLQIDFGKARLGDDRLWHFMADQALHLASLVVAILLWPTAYAAGIWPDLLPFSGALPEAMTYFAGAIIAVRMGQFLVAKLMQPLINDLNEEEGLKNGGAIIGLLERALTFLLVLAGQPAGVGFLIAAKSFLRVGTIEKNRKLAEYVIIGSLASIGWALLIAFATKGLLTLLETAPYLS